MGKSKLKRSVNTHALSPEQAFERLEALELDELNLRVAIQVRELEPSIRVQLLRAYDRITAEREQIMRILVVCNGGTIARS